MGTNNQLNKGGKSNMKTQMSLLILVGIFASLSVSTSLASVRIGCLNKDTKALRTWISADVVSADELQSVRYRLKNKKGMIVEDSKIKLVQTDKDLTDKKSVHFNLSSSAGSFEPEILVLPKKFDKQSQFEASLVQLTDGWGSVDNVTTLLSCRKLPLASR